MGVGCRGMQSIAYCGYVPCWLAQVCPPTLDTLVTGASYPCKLPAHCNVSFAVPKRHFVPAHACAVLWRLVRSRHLPLFIVAVGGHCMVGAWLLQMQTPGLHLSQVAGRLAFGFVGCSVLQVCLESGRAGARQPVRRCVPSVRQRSRSETL